MGEKWSKWVPVDIPMGKYELIKMQQDWNGVELVYDDEKTKLEVTYTEGILAIRSCDEGDRWKTIDNVLGKYGKDFFKDWLFYKVENSEFKRWFIQETFNSREENEFEHHVFVTANDIVDILSLKEPTIKVRNILSLKEPTIKVRKL